jgi:hypothetical protein
LLAVSSAPHWLPLIILKREFRMVRQAFGVREGSSSGPVVLATSLLALSGLASVASAQCPSLLTELPRESIGLGAGRIELADMNQDGRLDLVTTWGVVGSPGRLQMRMQLPGGGFGPVTETTVPQKPADFAIGDFNSDSAPDVVVAGATGGLYVIIDGVVTTLFTAGNCYAVATGDVNGDGKLDLMCAVRNSGAPVVQLYYIRGDGMGGFSVYQGISLGISNPPLASWGFVLEDLNGDGYSDLIFTAPWGLLQIYAGSRTLLGVSPIYSADTAKSRVAVADLNGDGRKDLVFTGTNTVWTYVNASSPQGFSFTPRSFGLAGASGMPGVMDVDRDGLADVVAGGSASQVSVLLGNGDGSLAAQPPFFSSSTNPESFTVGDVDGDGAPELVAPTTGGGGGLDSASFFESIAPVWTNPITTHPVGGAIAAGANVTLSVAVNRGTGFQWRRGGMLLSDGPHIAGTGTPTLTITGFDLYQIGAYDCVVTGCAAAVTSNPAVLTLETEPPCSIDFNGDGFVDFFDYDDFVTAYEQGC